MGRYLLPTNENRRYRVVTTGYRLYSYIFKTVHLDLDLDLDETKIMIIILLTTFDIIFLVIPLFFLMHVVKCTKKRVSLDRRVFLYRIVTIIASKSRIFFTFLSNDSTHRFISPDNRTRNDCD